MQYDVQFDALDATDKLKKYLARKVRELEKYVPLAVRESAELAVHMRADTSGKTCSLTLRVPGSVLAAHETTEHIYASIDVAVADIRRQLREYKARRAKKPLRQRVLQVLQPGGSEQ